MDNDNFNPRPKPDMVAVDMTCATCGKHIDRLPFKPSADRPVNCLDCHRKTQTSHGGRF